MTRRISNPFERVAHRTERTNAAKVSAWINEIVKERGLPFGEAEVDTGGADRRFPDLVIKARPGSEEIVCVIEMKPPAFDPYHQEELVDPAREKATRRRSPYFATSNFKELLWFNTARANELKPLEQQLMNRYTLSEIEDPDTIDEPQIRGAIQRGLERFLADLAEVTTGKKAEPKLAVDEFLIYRLHTTIKTLALHYKRIIEEQAKASATFSKQLQRWFIEQGWSFAFQDQDYEKAARQTAYLLVNKVLFYNVIQLIRRLDPLQIPKDLTKGSLLKKFLQGFFEEVLKIDYETIYSTDFIDQVAFPDNKDVVDEIKELVAVLARYDFSKLGYDVIGRIFERLIPPEERHILGQYFTNPDVVDLILRFCLRHETDKVFDPACGAGTFLVRAYQHKKLMNQRLPHEEILTTLWGVDIAKFPTHLTTINLAINDLRSDENYPRVIQRDFFDLLPDRVEFPLPQSWRTIQVKGLGKVAKTLEHPRFFDCIVGNPPYTRQEEIEEIQEAGKGYKDKLIHKALSFEGRPFAQLTKRAGIYAYFFIHGTKFLQNGGCFGFVVSNSWLDVDYGKGLQEHFLTHYKIIAIIESKVERWFEDADVNTAVVILEKASGERLKQEREPNLVRFVYLKQPLRAFIPAAEDMWERQVSRSNAIDELIKTILAHSSYYENEDLRIYPKTQKELWEEGWDPEEGRYVGAKWGKYLRAPKIFFTILEKAKDKLVPLKDVAKVRRGFTTGANEFFYLTEEQIKRWKIEREFWMHKDGQGQWVPNYVIKSPRECRSMVVKPEDLKYRVLMVHKDKKALKGTNVLKYIEWGERKGYHKRPTCASRSLWYDLGIREAASVNVNYLINDVARAFVGQFWASDDFQEIHTDVDIASFLNSTVFWLFQNIEGRSNFGGGLLKIQTYEFKTLPVYPKTFSQLISIFRDLSKRTVEPIFSELGGESTSQVTLQTIKPDRRLLDRLIMGDILGLADEEQLEVYRAVVDLVKNRLVRAQSVGKTKKAKEGMDVELFASQILNHMGGQLAPLFRERIASVRCFHRELPKYAEPIRIEEDLVSGWLLKVGRKVIDCPTEAQARYLRVFVEMGWETAPVPQEDGYLAAIVDEWEQAFQQACAVLEEHASSVLQRKLRVRIAHVVWTRLREQMEAATIKAKAK